MKKTKIVIDTDIGNDIDDTWAIVYALRRPAFDIKAICVTGCDTDYKAALVAKILTRLSRTDVAIIKGTNKGEEFAPQGGWLKDFSLASYGGEVTEDYRAGFEKYLREGTVLAGLAPNSTLAGISDILSERRTRIVAMAGSVYKGYFSSPVPVPECNVVTDIEASRSLYRADIDYTLLPLDVCGDLVLGGENYRRVYGSGSSAAKAVMENYLVWDRDYEGGAKKYPPQVSSTVLYDMAPFWYLEYPELFGVKRMKIAIDENGVTREARDGLNMTVALTVDKLGFLYGELADTLVKA